MSDYKYSIARLYNELDNVKSYLDDLHWRINSLELNLVEIKRNVQTALTGLPPDHKFKGSIQLNPLDKG